MIDEKATGFAQNALIQVMNACPGERLLVISDDVKSEVGRGFAYAGLEAGLYTRWISLETQKKRVRRELPDILTETIVSNRPDLVVDFLRGSAEETPFRIKLIHLVTRNKDVRLGHGPGTTLDMLTEGALALSAEEYVRMNETAHCLMAATDGASKIIMSAENGTNVEMSVQGRSFFTDVEITNQNWGNLPVGEITVGPLENSLKGCLVCDVAIGGVGPITEPLTIRCENGKATDLKCENKQVLRKVRETLRMDDMASLVGEMAIGLNPKARIVQEFVETEKVLGTAHIAFGRNTDFPTGGRNNSANHMDFLVNKPTIYAIFPDGGKRSLTSRGSILPKNSEANVGRVGR